MNLTTAKILEFSSPTAFIWRGRGELYMMIHTSLHSSKYENLYKGGGVGVRSEFFQVPWAIFRGRAIHYDSDLAPLGNSVCGRKRSFY